LIGTRPGSSFTVVPAFTSTVKIPLFKQRQRRIPAAPRWGQECSG
jgi:hypothetical protein